MIKPTGKETRSFEIRAAQDEEFVLEGYAATFNVQSTLIGGSFYETIAPGAFDKVLASGRDICLLNQHEWGEPLARIKNGSLTISADAKGLKFRAQLDKDSPLHQTAWRAVSSGLVTECSFMFMNGTTVDLWNFDVNPPQRLLLEVDLWEISVVTRPAYSGTTANARAEQEQSDADFRKAELQKLADIETDYQLRRDFQRAETLLKETPQATKTKNEQRGSKEFLAARCADALSNRSTPLDYCGHDADNCYGSDPQEDDENRCYRFAYDVDDSGNVALDEDSCETCAHEISHSARANKRTCRSMRNLAGIVTR